jgi:hypothetical protein
VHCTRTEVAAVAEERIGGRWRCLTGRRSQQVKKKKAGSLLRRFPTEDGGLGSWLAWRGSEVHEGGARWSALDAQSRGAR